MREALIDTNLLLLLAIESVAPDQVERHKRLKAFTNDLRVGFLQTLDGYPAHCTTPHILAETSNFLRYSHEALALAASDWLARYAQETVREVCQPSEELSRHPTFRTFGLTDTAIIAAAVRGVTVFTDDGALYKFIVNVGSRAVNVHHFQTPRYTR